MDLDNLILSSLQSLSATQKASLKRANIKHVSELVLTPPGELAKKLRISVSDVLSIVEQACNEVASSHLSLEELTTDGPTKFTAGDALLDSALGGGIRTGMIWELVGESSSGKTQLALQLSLLVQIKANLGGISGSTCYLSTHSALPTRRLSQLSMEHPLLSPSVCSLSDVHTQTVPTLELLMHALNVTLPALQKTFNSDPNRKPIKLIVIDSVFALLHTTERPSSTALFERSKAIVELSHRLHTIASRDNIAIVVINDVTDVFTDTPFSSQSQGGTHKDEILYRDQARWFGSAHSLPIENRKEAGLGLVWANQVNARIMLTRTNRRRYLDESAPGPKRQRLDNGVSSSSHPSSSMTNTTDTSDGVNGPILVRRLSVVFSSVSAHNSVDFVITKEGFSAVPNEMSMSPSVTSPHSEYNASRPQESSKGHKSSKSAFKELPGNRLDVIPSTFPAEEVELQDGDQYWAGLEDFPDDAFDEIDFDAVDNANVEADITASQAQKET